MLKATHPPQELIVTYLDTLYKSGKRILYVWNSCDFFIDSIAATIGFEVHSCDNSIIGRTIASSLINGVNAPRCSDDELKQVFEKWENHRYKSVVEVLFSLKIGKYANRKNDYQKTKYDIYIKEAGSFYERNMTVLERSGYLNFSIASFHSCQPSAFFAMATDDAHCLLNIMPVSLRKSQPFCFTEKIFASGFDKINPQRKATIKDYVSAFTNKEFSVISDSLHSELTDFLIGKSKSTHGNKSVFLYSSFSQSPIICDVRKSIILLY